MVSSQDSRLGNDDTAPNVGRNRSNGNEPRHEPTGSNDNHQHKPLHQHEPSPPLRGPGVPYIPPSCWVVDRSVK